MKLNHTAVVMGIALALFLGPRSATAWTSGPEETPGPQEARNVWSWAKSAPANEHAELLKRAFEQAGLPAPLFPSPSEPFKAQIFTEGGTTNGGLPSFIPAPLSNAKAIATRSYTLPGFAALPDHSYALWDWASGNERCPIDTVAGTDLDGKDPAVACHLFKSHMGILNSTHFPPQSSKTYAWYHTLALTRAKECKTLNDNFVKSLLNYADPDQRQRIDAMVKECEREALVIEAVGQHFLQDTWAMGHMWERWGTPFLSGFVNIDAGSSSISEERRARGLFVAAVAGLIHGADSLLHEKGIESRDQMSYGRSPDITWRQLTGVGFSGQGIGDIYADVLLSDPDYVTQRDKLLRCSAAGVSDVYRQTAMVSGGSTGSFVINPVGAECSSQRATNLAIWEGFGVNVVLRDPYLGIGVPVRLGVANPIVASLITGVVSPKTLSSTAKSALFAELRTDITRLGAFVELRKKAAPTDVDLANLGLSPDGFFMLTGRNGLLTQNQDDPPAPYADPGREANPSHLQDPDTHARYIARVFHKAHVADWCIDDEADPGALRARVQSATPDETTAAYEACVEFTERHVRLGSMPSICEAATASSLPYSFEDTTGATNVKTAAMRFCGCDKAAKSMTAVNDSASTKLNTPVKIDVKANDTAPDGLPLNQLVFSALQVVDPSKGNVTENPDGTITFTPADNVTGDVVIEYALKSPCGATSNTAKLRVTVASGEWQLDFTDATAPTAPPVCSKYLGSNGSSPVSIVGFWADYEVCPIDKQYVIPVVKCVGSGCVPGRLFASVQQIDNIPQFQVVFAGTTGGGCYGDIFKPSSETRPVGQSENYPGTGWWPIDNYPRQISIYPYGYGTALMMLERWYIRNIQNAFISGNYQTTYPDLCAITGWKWNLSVSVFDSATKSYFTYSVPFSVP